MRKTFFVTMILLIAVGWAVAQNPSTPPMSEQPGAQSPSSQSPGAQNPASPTSPSAQPGAPGQQQPGMPGATTQQPGTPADQAAQDASAAAAGSSIEGCLGGSAGNFTVIDKSGTTYQLQLPAGADSSKLNSHIGEEVRVSGTMANAKQPGDTSAASSTSPAGAAGAASQPSISVTKIDKIGDKCTSNVQNPPSK
ncbi:MAG TPA: hypothetical protein VFU86_02945 [Terriglobales bacterium]|nr:hypothetical protein [Terriglobales bacterium]